jgi:MinD-like ATPase involved in chromosome partitioning or flagellar assembly
MLISFISAKGSPGVTTAVMAVASRWPRPAIATDLDPQGGDILAGVGGGNVPATHGVVDVVVDARRTDLLAAMHQHVTRPAAHSPLVLAGFGAPGQATGIPWEPMTRQFTDLPGAEVLADCGRFVVGHPVVAALRNSDLTVVVTGSSLRSVRATARTLPLIRAELGLPPQRHERGPAERLVLVVAAPNRPYDLGEIARACGSEVIGSLPHDPDSTQVWVDGAEPRRSFRRSALQHAAFDLAFALMDRATALRSADAPVAATARLDGTIS